VGSIIVATGYDVFDPHRKPELGYGQYPNVITSLEMERRLATEDLTGFPKPVRSVAFIQCVGSRDAQVGNPYCSRVCCMYTAKQARLVRELLPEANVTVFFIDVRAFGKGAEEFYDEVRARRVLYRRGNVSEIYRRGDRVVLMAEDTLLHHPIEFEADLVVLAVGMEPRVTPQVAARRHGGGRRLPGGLLPGAERYSRHRRAGEGGGLLGPHPPHPGHGAGGIGDGGGGRGRVRRVWDVRGCVSLRRAGP
jgi:heterodisulfide reductase subunit A